MSYVFILDKDQLLTVIDAPVVLAAVTIIALVSWWFTPADQWLQKERIVHFIESPGVAAGIKSPEVLVK